MLRNTLRNRNRLKPLSFHSGHGIRPGYYEEYGATPVNGGVSFTIESQNATYCELLLFKRQAEQPYAIIPFPSNYKIGNVYSMIVYGLEIDQFEYVYRLDGPYDPDNGLLFNPEQPILDPYAKNIVTFSLPGRPDEKPEFPYRARVVASDFDWWDEVNPQIPMSDLIIYELHVRGFTRHHSSGVTAPGTFLGLKERIPYLKRLGVNAVELQPIFAFDENLDKREYNNNILIDYWGYNPISFFAPHSKYMSGFELTREGNELKSLIRELHHNGIEVFLDVVYNHTAEGDENGRIINFKGIDNNVYYLLAPDGTYYNFSGCGNTFNCNHPVVLQMIRRSLRYWTTEFRIDGYRFDLASILTRDEKGHPMKRPPLLESLARDPILANVKLIAEAWDAGGMYQVGTFPAWKRWSEWNGKYRDDVRCFLKGDAGLAETAAKRIMGSPDIYDEQVRGTDASVNFITCHDGFTLRDLYSYSTKHNLGNGWNNTDGENNNNSWNCGHEGDTDDPEVLALRSRMVRNAYATLLCSRGTPLILAGDEFGNTQFGNNNAYCQDNEISWLNWDQLEENQDLFNFVRGMICIRKKYSLLRRASKLPPVCGYPQVSFHGHAPFVLDRSFESRFMGLMYSGHNEAMKQDEFVLLYLNMHWEGADVILPELPPGYQWHLHVNTSAEQGEQVVINRKQTGIVKGHMYIPAQTVVLLAGRLLTDGSAE